VLTQKRRREPQGGESLSREGRGAEDQNQEQEEEEGVMIHTKVLEIEGSCSSKFP